MKPRTFILLLAGVGIWILIGSASPAKAWWQFVSLDANGARKASPRYKSEQECKAALKSTEAALKKAFPDHYPLVGSCEEFR